MTEAGRQPPVGPPIWTPLNSPPSLMPPPTSKMTSFKDIPIGTSARPDLTTLPVSANTFVPLLPSVPRAAYFSEPLAIIQATLANVSTLLMQVGLAHRQIG